MQRSKWLQLKAGGVNTACSPSLPVKVEFKPYKAPFKQIDENVSKGGRKRKRVDYSSMGGGGDNGADGDADAGSDSDAENRAAGGKAGKKKKGIQMDAKFMKGVGQNGAPLVSNKHSFIKLKRKGGDHKSQFRFPTMRNKEGDVKELKPSFQPLGVRAVTEIPPRPLHDPMGESAIVLFDPTVHDRDLQREKERLHLLQLQAEERLSQAEQQQSELQSGSDPPASSSTTTTSSETASAIVKSVHKSLAEMLGIAKKDAKQEIVKVPVVIDPQLAKILRPHQVEGVKFLYRCSTGLVQENCYGSIMADGMGLGKTLQCIALMWTLLRQSPLPRKPTIEKCIIACPSTLVRNWANELKKWLKDKEPGSLVIDGTLSKEAMIESVRRWCDTRGKSVTRPVMIVSYETLRNLTTVLGEAEVGLLLCDEGHRLKNADSLTFKALQAIKVKRRIILSGTPIQNDLTEYFALLDFANPNLLGSAIDFHKNFEQHILRGRDSDASEKEIAKGEEKLKEFTALVSKFIIRRSNELNTKYRMYAPCYGESIANVHLFFCLIVPVKYEHVVFCQMSDFQRDLYRHFLKSPDIRQMLRGKGSQPLKAINVLKKLCNHPDLLKLEEDIPGGDKFYPDDYKAGVGRFVNFDLSGKTQVLERFIRKMRRDSKDKIVLISNYTQTLDVFERMCRQNNWGSFRLDGTMTAKKRQKYVDEFNDPEQVDRFVFLLSSKAGGCGINLIGANRLVLFDPDWNPAADQQALARVWREGQTKTCFVYRFISTGSIEEKILQRQLSKQALSKCVVDEAENQERQFSLKDLKVLFEFNEDTESDTHDTLKCPRCRDGVMHTKAPAMLNEDCNSWNHYSRKQFKDIHDDLLREELGHEIVSFVFQFCST